MDLDALVSCKIYRSASQGFNWGQKPLAEGQSFKNNWEIYCDFSCLKFQIKYKQCNSLNFCNVSICMRYGDVVKTGHAREFKVLFSHKLAYRWKVSLYFWYFIRMSVIRNISHFIRKSISHFIRMSVIRSYKVAKKFVFSPTVKE